VTYATPIIPVNRELYDQISGVLASIQDFSVIVQGAAENLDAEIKAQAEAIGGDNAVGGAGASSLLFTSIMHNVINQMLLALKAGPVAKMAIEALKNGQKPVITLANTMESLLSDYAAHLGLKTGDVIHADFGSVLTKYLDRTRTLIIKKPFSEDPVVRKYLTDEELGAEGLAAYNSAKAQIEPSRGSRTCLPRRSTGSSRIWPTRATRSARSPGAAPPSTIPAMNPCCATGRAPRCRSAAAVRRCRNSTMAASTA
jgi:hypothetical protein